MASSSKQAARSLDTLDRDIKVLRKKAKLLEKQIDESFVYLQEHTGSMLFNSLLPRRREEDAHTYNGKLSWGANLFYMLLQNEQLREKLGKLTGSLAEKLGNRINRLIDRIFRE